MIGVRWVVPLLAAVVLCTADGLVIPTQGAPVIGSLEVTEAGVGSAGRPVPWANVAVFALHRQPARAIGGGVVGRDGSVLRGLPRVLDQGTLNWTSDLLGPRQQKLETVAAVILGPLTLDALPDLLAGGPGALLVNGERLAGTLTFLNGEAVGLDTGRRVAQVPRGRVTAIVLRQIEPAPQACTWLMLANGDRIPAGGDPGASPAAVIAGWNAGPGFLPLGQTVPKRMLAIDRMSSTLPIRPGTGFPTEVGGLATNTGVRLPARGEIAWAAKGYGQFLAWAAVPAGGEAVVASVVLDGTVAWEQTLQPDAAATPVSVPLHDAAEITLRAAPTADGETADRQVVWGMPTLVK